MNLKSIPPNHSFSYDGVNLKIYHANKGEGLPMHGHEYSHGITCHSGCCKVSLENGKSVLMNKNTQPINLLAGIQHEIEALEDETVFVNVFAEGKY
jgi:quercetin dioxygenase-like cupin family protein